MREPAEVENKDSAKVLLTWRLLVLLVAVHEGNDVDRDVISRA